MTSTWGNIPTGSGWTCGSCKAWVPSGTNHSCYVQSQPSNWVAPAPGIDYTMILIRIANALERIADKLDDSPGN